MLVNGNIIKLAGRESSSTLKVIYTTDNLPTIRPMASGYIRIRMVHAMRVNGKTTSNTVLVLKPYPEVKNMKVSTTWEKRKEEADILTETVHSMKDSGIEIKSMDLACKNGKMDDTTMDSGQKTTCMDMEPM